MEWKKVAAASRVWAGGVNPKLLYAAIRSGELKAARIGAGRNLLVCEAFIEEWLKASSVRKTPRASNTVAMMHPRDVA